MRTVFADTQYYLALANKRDALHRRAVALSQSLRCDAVTTAWVLTEVGDALAASEERQIFLDLLDDLRRDPHVTLVDPTRELFEDGLAFYAGRMDKDWSLTDCISFVVMNQRGIREALTGDHHFEQAGFVALLK
jgi:predicted nucleic acid-binding protein